MVSVILNVCKIAKFILQKYGAVRLEFSV